MNRPWQIGLAFGLCLAVVLAAMGWTSREVLRLDRAEAEARRHAQQEENVRLALWRMESALAPLVVQESAQPYFAYTAFYPAERAYSRMFNDDLRQKELLLPSPILVQTSPYILLSFQFGPRGELTSPQVPAGSMRELAESAYTTAEALDAAAARLRTMKTLVSAGALAAALPQHEGAEPLVPAVVELATNATAQPPPQPAPPQGGQADQQQAAQVKRSKQEWQARAQVLQSANTAGQNQWEGNRLLPGDVREGVMKAVWLGDALVLARRVSVNGEPYIQGAWLNWPAIRTWLLGSVKDLVPEGDLVPVKDGAGEEGARMLAALPVRLVPGTVPTERLEAISPTALSLGIAWVCVLLAAAAVGVLLLGTVKLSERRGDFVSAVTHELRTPLTTFRMYSEMLAEGMVTDEAKRRRYLQTLRVEAERLSHLVENVLAYARLERGRAHGKVEPLAVADLVGRVRGRLADRAGQAGMQLVVEASASDGVVLADASAVEQILFNLVDNACKYAATAEDRRIQLVAAGDDTGAVLKVCDHGPGISPADASRLFRPFSKSARDAANSAPGVGLGLALSRRLAREMGGDLTHEPQTAGGACFVLALKRPPSARA